MKKHVFAAFIVPAFAVMLTAAGCENVFGKKPPDVPADSELTRKDILALQHLREDHISTEEALAGQVYDFLSKDVSTRSVTPNVPAVTNVKKFISKTDKGFSGMTANARAASGASETREESEIPFYIFEIANKNEDKKGFALTCGDDRIGNILAVAESGSPDLDNPFMELYYTNLEAYIGETIEIYNSVTDEDIAVALTKAGKESERFTATSDFSFKDFFNTYDYDTDGKTRLKTAWGQHEPYWDTINKVKNRTFNSYADKYVTGCLTTAMAQIMAYWEYPDSCDIEPYSTFHYSWDVIKAVPDLRYVTPHTFGGNSVLSEHAKHSASILMYQVAEAVIVQYGTNATGGSTGYLTTNAFNTFGYATPDGHIDYDISAIVSSIDNGRPVAIEGFDTLEHTVTQYKRDNYFLWWFLGTDYWEEHKDNYLQGHAWVIDDYCTRAKPVIFFKDLLCRAYYVHCNLGWDGSKNGWYASGVFDTEKDPVALKSTKTIEQSEGWYRYNMKIIPNIYPIKL